MVKLKDDKHQLIKMNWKTITINKRYVKKLKYSISFRYYLNPDNKLNDNDSDKSIIILGIFSSNSFDEKKMIIGKDNHISYGIDFMAGEIIHNNIKYLKLNKTGLVSNDKIRIDIDLLDWKKRRIEIYLNDQILGGIYVCLDLPLSIGVSLKEGIDQSITIID